MPEEKSWLEKAGGALKNAAARAIGTLGPAGKVIEGLLGGKEGEPPSPELLLARAELQRVENAIEEIRIAGENVVVEANARILEANAKSYQHELAQDDNYTKRWRPTLGYILGFGFFFNLVGLPIAKMVNPEFEPPAGNLALLTIVAGLLGVGTVHRGSEKKEKIRAQAQNGSM
jgi:hypothetical protein